MRSLVILVFKREAEGKLPIKDRERGMRKENEVRAIINKCREENILREK